jgi:hypothetical protein
MKRYIKILTIAAFLVTAPFILSAQNPPDPPGPPTGGGTVGSGASVGDGVFILLTLAVAYGSRKYYVMRNAKEVETEKA